ncbi:MAG: ABC transporter ATP-binding protein [Betaproteobacteria bacterium]|nr:ABC transporter ATP-binding protein [Betaproteobacteria bacterium]
MTETVDYVIDIEGMSKYYALGEDKISAVNKVSLKIPGGAFAAVCGPSGSGKSTLLNICGLLDTFDAGQYHLNKTNVGGLNETERTKIRRKEIGFIFQSYNLIPVMDVFDNVAYPLRLLGKDKLQIKAETAKILEKVGLTKFATRIPDQLSGGQRQRVAIARALVKRPTLVIADEPTANLDTKTAETIVALMKELGNQFSVTFLIATHDERMTRHCDKIYNITDGVLA